MKFLLTMLAILTIKGEWNTPAMATDRGKRARKALEDE